MKQVTIFTDGACRGNPGPGGWGAVLTAGDHVKEIKGAEQETTNNRMELRALIEAFRALPDDRDLVVHSDSQLCVNTINEWAVGWERRGWTERCSALARRLSGRPTVQSRPEPGIDLLGARWPGCSAAQP